MPNSAYQRQWFVKKKNLFLIIPVLFIIIGTATLMICLEKYQGTLEQSLRDDRAAAGLVSIILEERFRQIVKTLESYANRPLLIQAAKKKDRSSAMRHLVSLSKSNPGLNSVVLTDKAATIWALYPLTHVEMLGKNVAYREWYQTISRDWKPHIANVTLRLVDEKDAVVQVSVPVFDEQDEVVGILLNTQRTIVLGELIQKIQLEPGCSLHVVDRNGVLIYSSQLAYDKKLQPYPYFSVREEIKNPVAQSLPVIGSSAGGNPAYVSYAPITYNGWSVFISRDNQALLQRESHYFIQAASIALLLFITTTLALLYVRKKLLLQSELEKLTAELENQVRVRTEHLTTAIEALKRSNQELEQFAYVASHDLQEPLRMIASFTQLLAREYRGKLDAEADEYIHYVVDGANRMQALIQDLLGYSRVASRGKPFEEVDLNEILGAVHKSLQLQIQETGAVIGHGILPTIMSDATQMFQLFQNLLSNSLKFRRDELPLIQISAVEEGEYWHVTVSDNGIGIEPQYFERIFKIFQRLHTRAEYPGTGIGLAVCQRIVERHNGRIWVESEPGTGSTFHFTLLKNAGVGGGT